ncbi:hypothetical protein M3Y97_00504600 [Aphelenchoides bicaudatus]|nr:hypothetical protein M3Y97_00504600 [Aphelenchoides bicaudatus]
MPEFEIRKANSLEVFYTGGDFALNANRSRLFTTCGGLIKVLSVSNGQEIYSVGDSEDSARVTCFTLQSDCSHIVVAYNNGIIKQYRLHDESATMLCQFRSTHTGPILVCKLSPDGQQLFTGSADYTVKAWNITERSCLRTLKGSSVVSAMCLVGTSMLVVGYVEGQMRIYDLSKKSQLANDLTQHSSRIAAILFDEQDSSTVYVVSRDQTLSVVDLETQAVKKVFPLFEPIRSCYLRQIFKANCDCRRTRYNEILGSEKRCYGRKELDGIIFNKQGSMFICSTVEQNLIFVDANSNAVTKQLAGFNEEILDVAFVSYELNCIAVATNSPQLRLYDLSNFNCTLVEGHTDLILSVDSPRWESGLLASSSKDNSCMFWQIIKNEENANLLQVVNVGVATGHTNSVVDVSFCKHRSSEFVVTVSNDSTLKLWNLKPLLLRGDEKKFAKLVADATFVAHSKEITCVEISDNDKLCVTGSMDKTAKLWHIDIENMQLGIAGTLSGHKRGVWSAKFSNSSQIVATASGDCTIKLFSLTDLSCQMTLEGHSFAVLNINFINNSTQLLSTDSNGLLKMWTVKSGVCEKTVECHEDKIWALQVIEPSAEALDRMAKRKRKMAETETQLTDFKLLPDEYRRYVSAGADGRIIVWSDITEEYAQEQARLAAERMAQVQTLENFIRLEKYEDALKLTLTLDHPYQCYKTLSVIITKDRPLDNLFTQLDENQLVKLLDFTSRWNTNTRTYAVGQTVLNVLLRNFKPQRLMQLPNYPDMVKALLPYTKRHFDRLLNMKQDVAFINYLTSRMEALEVSKN